MSPAERQDPAQSRKPRATSTCRSGPRARACRRWAPTRASASSGPHEVDAREGRPAHVQDRRRRTRERKRRPSAQAPACATRRLRTRTAALISLESRDRALRPAGRAAGDGHGVRRATGGGAWWRMRRLCAPGQCGVRLRRMTGWRLTTTVETACYRDAGTRPERVPQWKTVPIAAPLPHRQRTPATSYSRRVGLARAHSIMEPKPASSGSRQRTTPS
jgi:hypothetical protein